MTPVLTVTPNPAIDISTSTEHVVPIRKLRCTTVRRDAGGGGINVARVVRRLGSDVTAIYPAGGSTGQLLRRLVESENVRSIAIDVAEETREDFTVAEERTRNQFRFVMPGPLLTHQEWRACLDAIDRMDALPLILVCSGSLPPGVPDDFYARIARIAAARGSKLILDTSGRPLAAALQEGVFLVKPNLRELREFANAPLEDEQSWIAESRRLIDAGGAEIVALTLADKGALLITREGALYAGAPNIEPVSAVGAGDSFVGGIVSALAWGHSIAEAFRWGVAAGSAAVLNAGTELCHAPDVIRLYDEIKTSAFRPSFSEPQENPQQQSPR
jgi:6-phosphofructokinase 2